MAVPNIFATQSGSVPAAELDQNFAYILANTVQTASPNTFTAAQTMSGAAFNEAKGADVPSAASINLTTTTGNYVTISGTNTITSVTLASGALRMVRATGAFTWTNNAAIVVQGGANWVATAGDLFFVRGDAAGVVYVIVLPSTAAGQRTLAGLGTMATQNASAVAITGGTADALAVTGSTIDSSAIGGTTPAAGAFTTLSTTGLALLASLRGGVQALSGAGAINTTTLVTAWTTTGANAGTLADGVAGQIKIIYCPVYVGDGTLTPTNLGAGTTITFNTAGDAVILLFNGTDWWVVANYGCTVA